MGAWGRRIGRVGAAVCCIGAWLLLLLAGDAAVCAAPETRDNDNPYGVFCQFFREDFYTISEIERACTLIERAGIRWVFVNFFWDRVESRPGVFRFDLSDRIVDIAARHHLNLAVMLAYSTRWAGASPEGVQGRDLFVYPPRVPADFADFVRKTVRRYRTRVRYWQIWGEPNMPENWKPRPDAAAYARLLRAASRAAREADPTCRVLLGSLNGRMDDYLEDLYKAGARDLFDVAVINPYVNPLSRRDMFSGDTGAPASLLARKIDRVRDVMARYGDGGKPLWIGEIGCPGQDTPGSWWCEGGVPDPRMQARWLTYLYTHLPGYAGIERVFWYNFRTANDELQAQAGLVNGDFTLKPAYEAYRAVIQSARTRGGATSGRVR